MKKLSQHSGVFTVPSMRSHHRNTRGTHALALRYRRAAGLRIAVRPTVSCARFTRALKSLQRATPLARVHRLSTSLAQ